MENLLSKKLSQGFPKGEQRKPGYSTTFLLLPSLVVRRVRETYESSPAALCILSRRRESMAYGVNAQQSSPGCTVFLCIVLSAQLWCRPWRRLPIVTGNPSPTRAFCGRMWASAPTSGGRIAAPVCQLARNDRKYDSQRITSQGDYQGGSGGNVGIRQSDPLPLWFVRRVRETYESFSATLCILSRR